jgi:hypothetical protein
LQSQNVYFLSRTDTGTYDPDIFAVAKYQDAGASAAWQDVVFAFVNNNYAGSSNRWGTFNVNAVTATGSNRFGIVTGHNYNLVNLLASDTNAHVWSQDVTGSTLISGGITVGLTASGTSGGQAQYLKLIDTTQSTAGQVNDYANPDTDGDGMPNTWETAHGLNPQVANPNADSDHDGVSDYLEYIAGTDPANASSCLKVNNIVATSGTDIALTWASVPGVDYQVKASGDLSSWNALPPAVTADGSQTAVHISISGTTPKEFFRVEVKR